MEITYTCPECGAELDPNRSVGEATVICPKCALKVPLLDRRIGAGTRIGGFEIKKLIGKGAMGEVYLARQLSMDRDIALKILAPHVAGHAYAVQRFLKEVRLSAQIEHPNVVRAYEAGEDQGVYYLAMAYVKGESLSARLKRVGRFTEVEAISLGRKMADALHRAWSDHGLLHRDIKPSNILLSERGEPLLADLGLAKQRDESEQGLTQTGSVLGTPNYMSPEQIDGRKAIDTRTDMYGLGTTLYHAVTGRIPFAGSTLVETLKLQATEPLQDPRSINESLSDGFVQILIRMLAKDPDDRYPDWPSLIADLDEVRAGHASRLPALRAGQSVMLRADEALAETVRLEPTVRNSPAELAPRTGFRPIPLLAGIVGVVALGGGIWWATTRPPAETDPGAPRHRPGLRNPDRPPARPSPRAGSLLSMEEIGRILDQASEGLLALDGTAVRAHIDAVREQIPEGRPLPPQIEGMERVAIMIEEMEPNLYTPEMRERLQTSAMAEADLLLGILAYQDGNPEEAVRLFESSASLVGETLIRRIETRAPRGEGRSRRFPPGAGKRSGPGAED